SSRRRRVSSRYSSKARLPLDRDGCHQVPDGRIWSAAPCQRVSPPLFQQLIRPLPMINARVARPTGHHTMKPRIVSTIQAGFPNSWTFERIAMRASPVNVNYIYILVGLDLGVKWSEPRLCGRRTIASRGQAQTVEIDQHRRLQQILRRHWE